MKRLLRVSNIRRIAFPGIEHRSLQSASIGKAQLPRHTTQRIHCIEVLGSFHITLSARKKDDSGDSRGHDVFHAAQSRFSDMLHGSLLRTVFSRCLFYTYPSPRDIS
jgi:hypothetical protein